MEHILQFAISIDDDTIKKQIEKSATAQVAQSLKNCVYDKIFNKWGSFTEQAEQIIKEVAYGCRDEIIEKAVELVVDSIKRSKKYREALSKIVEEVEE